MQVHSEASSINRRPKSGRSLKVIFCHRIAIRHGTPRYRFGSRVVRLPVGRSAVPDLFPDRVKPVLGTN